MLDAVKEIARFVGARIRDAIEDGSRGLSIQYKGRSDLVTEIDLWSEDEIKKFVMSNFPDHVVIGEETSAQLCKSKGLSIEQLLARHTCWIVDPVDGTTNFANGIPHCAVSIGVYECGTPRIGVIYDPARDELFAAEIGKGATRNDVPIFCSEKTTIEESVINTGFPYNRTELWPQYQKPFEVFLKQSRNVRVFGSAALDQAWVACGRVDGFYEYNLKPWDIAAGVVIVEEARGASANFAESSPETLRITSNSYLCAGKKLFPSMLALAQSAHFDSPLS